MDAADESADGVGERQINYQERSLFQSAKLSHGLSPFTTKMWLLAALQSISSEASWTKGITFKIKGKTVELITFALTGYSTPGSHLSYISDAPIYLCHREWKVNAALETTGPDRLLL